MFKPFSDSQGLVWLLRYYFYYSKNVHLLSHGLTSNALFLHLIGQRCHYHKYIKT